MPNGNVTIHTPRPRLYRVGFIHNNQGDILSILHCISQTIGALRSCWFGGAIKIWIIFQGRIYVHRYKQTQMHTRLRFVHTYVHTYVRTYIYDVTMSNFRNKDRLMVNFSQIILSTKPLLQHHPDSRTLTSTRPKTISKQDTSTTNSLSYDREHCQATVRSNTHLGIKGQQKVQTCFESSVSFLLLECRKDVWWFL